MMKKMGDEVLEECMKERYGLAKERIREIITEETVKKPFGDFFRNRAKFLSMAADVMDESAAELTMEALKERNHCFYQDAATVEGILRSYVNDYCQDMMEQRIREGVDPELDFAADIIMNSDLSDLRYLYRYGEFVSENETGVAEFLNSLSQEEIDKMASTYTEGYRIGFITGRKDITKK